MMMSILVYEHVGFVLGYVPLMTKGIFTLHFGGPEVVNQLKDEKPNKASLIFLMLSLSFQILLWIYKRLRMMKFKPVSSYVNSLRQTLVENVYNVYGFVILIFVSFVCLIFVVNHRDNNTIRGGDEKKIKAFFPEPFFIMIGFCVVCCNFPYVKSHALR